MFKPSSKSYQLIVLISIKRKGKEGYKAAEREKGKKILLLKEQKGTEKRS